MNKRKKIILLVVLLIVIIGVYFINDYLTLRKYRKQVSEITISSVDLSKISDGTYSGSYEVTWVAAEVKVTVEDNKIKNIELIKHKNGRGERAEVILDKVLEKQSLKVDFISGATSSSKVILKAVENALN